MVRRSASPDLRLWNRLRTAVLPLAVAVTAAGSPTVSELQIKAGGKGLALVLVADRPFATAARTQSRQTPSGTSSVAIRLPDCFSALKEGEFTGFGAACPVKRIVARSRQDGVGLDLLLESYAVLDKDVSVHLAGNRQIVLLSADGFQEVAWSSGTALHCPPPAVSAAGHASTQLPVDLAPQPRQVASVCLVNVGITQRGGVAQCFFEFDGPAVMNVKRDGGKLLLVFANSRSSIAKEEISLPQNTVALSIRLKQQMRDNQPLLGVTLFCPEPDIGALCVSQAGNRVTVMSQSHSGPGFLSWSEKAQRLVCAAFAEPQPAVAASVIPVAAVALAAIGAKPAVTQGVPAPPIPKPAPAGSGDPEGVLGPRSAAPTVSPVAKADPAQSQPVQYRIYGRDPFVPFSGQDDDGLPNVENLELVGVMWDEQERIALLENPTNRERCYALREQDPVEHGNVWRITATSAVFLVTEFGISRTYTLNIKKAQSTGSVRN